jgi:tripartite-type tricarboxylate transporter receptor subunit TctC
MSRRVIVKALIGSAIALSVCAPLHAVAQEAAWPTKPIKFLVPFPPGGATDGISRHITAKLQTALGQPVIVENVAGMAGGLAMARLATTPGDGYTIGLAHTGTHAINPHIYSNLKYDPVKDFTPIARLNEYVNVLVVNAKEPYKTFADLIKAAKEKPGSINFGSAGNGSSNHLSAELLAHMAGVKFTHVPYKGSAPAMNDLLGGNINFMFDLMITSQQHLQSGRLRALATTGRERLKQEPNLPTISETIPGYEVVGWSAVVAPPGVPRAIVNRLTSEIAKILRTPDTIERFTNQGFEVAYSTPEQLAEVIKKDLALWGPIVKSSGAKAD